MHRPGAFGRLFGMRTKRTLLALACLMVVISAGWADAAVPIHATTITSASGHWILGPAGKGRVRYASAGFYEKNQNGEIFSFAYAFMGTCKERALDMWSCRTERSASDDDHETRFFMDPSMQVATLEIGPHRVEWDAGVRTPWVTFYGVPCDPDDEDTDGAKLIRGALAEAELFGRTMSSDDHPSEYGHVSRGAIVSECAFRSLIAGRRAAG